MTPSDFPTAYKQKWVRAYPLVAGMRPHEVDVATPAELDEAFSHVLNNLWLQSSHAVFLNDKEAS